MDRLTKKTSPTASSNFVLLPIIPPMPPVMGEHLVEAHREAVNTYQAYAGRLCEYEDTGLSPDDVACLTAELEQHRNVKQYLNACMQLNQRCPDYLELQAYRKDEADGVLVRLPCSPGTKIYTITTHCADCPEDSDCENCMDDGRHVTDDRFAPIMFLCGLPIFFTREEAETALKAQEDACKCDACGQSKGGWCENTANDGYCIMQPQPEIQEVPHAEP